MKKKFIFWGIPVLLLFFFAAYMSSFIIYELYYSFAHSREKNVSRCYSTDNLGEAYIFLYNSLETKSLKNKMNDFSVKKNFLQTESQSSNIEIFYKRSKSDNKIVYLASTKYNDKNELTAFKLFYIDFNVRDFLYIISPREYGIIEVDKDFWATSNDKGHFISSIQKIIGKEWEK